VTQHDFSADEWTDARRLIQLSLDEDAALDDVTTQISVPEGTRAVAELRSREGGVFAGVMCAAMTFEALDADVTVERLVEDGLLYPAGTVLLRFRGDLAAILAAERTILNILGLLSGTATLTHKFATAAGPNCSILDTRKTWPGARRLQKYAVRCGGGRNHRMSLADAILLKDNHRWLGLSLSEMVKLARANHGKLLLEVEVDNFEQLEAALDLDVDRVLLDNFTPEQIEEACKLRTERGSDIPFEASGGVTLATVAQLAAAGADFVSVGALTHSAPSLDLGLDIQADADSGAARADSDA
jgi:nicotinate-nucleotide pyrophosphorylase (carboxylating)